VISVIHWSDIYPCNKPDTNDDSKLTVRKGFGDEKYISPDKLQKLFYKDFKWLLYNINKIEKPTIVITHHLPTYKLMHPYYKDKYIGYHNRFYTNLEHLIHKPLIGWIGGHSHSTIDIRLNEVFLGINAVGNRGVLEQAMHEENGINKTFDIRLIGGESVIVKNS